MKNNNHDENVCAKGNITLGDLISSYIAVAESNLARLIIPRFTEWGMTKEEYCSLPKIERQYHKVRVKISDVFNDRAVKRIERIIKRRGLNRNEFQSRI